MGTVTRCKFDIFYDFLWASNISFSAVLYINASRLTLTNFEVSFVYIDQVTQLFHVNLDEREFKPELDVVRSSSNVFE